MNLQRVDPLHIAMVCPYSFDEPGGVQSHVVGLAGWLTDAGHRVDILAPGRAEPTWLASHGLSSDQLTDVGQALPVRYNGSVARITFGPHTHSRVRQWLRRVQPDLIHVHEPITPSAAVHAVWTRNAPVVATFHTATPGSRTMRLAGQLMKGTIAAIDTPIAVSSAARQVVVDHIGLDPVVIGNGFTPPAPLAPVGRLWRGGDRPRVTFVGRYDEPRKGFEVFRRAVALVARRRPIEVVVVGRGRPLDWQLPGGSSVHFTGRIDDHRRDRVLAGTDVYVAPHLGRESFGIVLIEALASGAAVVASDLAAFREVISDADGPVGQLVPVGDAEAAAAAIETTLRLRSDPARSRARAAQFEWARVAPQILHQYRATVTRLPGDELVPVNDGNDELVTPGRGAATTTRRIA